MSSYLAQNPVVLASAITAVGSVLAGLIAATAAAIIGREFSSRAKLRAERDSLLRDLHFLLKVEEYHCNLHKSTVGMSNFRRIRNRVRSETGLQWSGRFTPGRAESSLE